MNVFHVVGMIVLVICVLAGMAVASTPRALGGSAVGVGWLIAIGGGLSSIIPFGFGSILSRLDVLLSHNKHLDRLDPDLREKLDIQAAERKALDDKIAQSRREMTDG